MNMIALSIKKIISLSLATIAIILLNSCDYLNIDNYFSDEFNPYCSLLSYK